MRDATTRDLERRNNLPDGVYLIGNTIVKEGDDVREKMILAAQDLETTGLMVDGRPLAGIEMDALLMLGNEQDEIGKRWEAFLLEIYGAKEPASDIQE